VTVTLGRPRRHFRRTDSTNARAKELARAGAPAGLVVTADEQTAGRGRQGRTWLAAPGSALLYSALLRPLGDRPLLPLAVPLAVSEAAEALAEVSCRLKWPNDVWIGERKLAGVLVEGHPGPAAESWAVIGVGLNVRTPAGGFPPEIAAIAAALDGGATVPAALTGLNDRLERWLAAGDAEVLAAWRERDALLGRPVSWQGGSGTAAGIDDEGHLLVEVPGRDPVRLGAGEVHLGPAPNEG
jgi:BirA family biotin operon repressor/biotin-[acetyl-CoA-carboxylase] ligase